MQRAYQDMHHRENGHDLIEYEIFNSNKSKLKMHANYYNGRLDCWEPFVEKFSLTYNSQS